MNLNKTVSVSIKLKIFFSSFKTKGIYLAAGIACIVNTWLYHFLTMLQLSRKGTVSVAFYLSFVWYDLAVMWLAKVFAHSKENFFSKVLPFSRELCTTYVTLFTEAVNTFTFLLGFIFFQLLRKGDAYIENSHAVLLVSAFVHLVVSISAPFMQSAQTKRNALLSCILPLVFMETIVFIAILLKEVIMPVFVRTPALFYALLAAVLAVSCVANSVLVRRTYEKR